MNSRRYAVAALAGLNLCSGVLHVAFEGVLRKCPFPYGRLLVVENALVAFVFFGFGLVLICGRERRVVRAATAGNIAWWGALVLEILFVRPDITTLTHLARLLPCSDTVVIVVGGLAAVLLGHISLADANTRRHIGPHALVPSRHERPSRDA